MRAASGARRGVLPVKSSKGKMRVGAVLAALLLIAAILAAIVRYQWTRPRSLPANRGSATSAANSKGSSIRVEVVAIELSQQSGGVQVTLDVILHGDKAIVLSAFELFGMLRSCNGLSLTDAEGNDWVVCIGNRDMLQPPPIDRDYVHVLPPELPSNIVVYLGAGTQLCRKNYTGGVLPRNGKFIANWTLSAMDEHFRQAHDVTASGSGVWILSASGEDGGAP